MTEAQPKACPYCRHKVARHHVDPTGVVGCGYFELVTDPPSRAIEVRRCNCSKPLAAFQAAIA